MGTLLPTLCQFLGRVCLSSIFLFSGFSKILNFDQVSRMMENKGMTTVSFFLTAGILLEVIGGLTVLFGYKAKQGAVLLMIFLIPTTYLFHNFWDLSGKEASMQLIMFLKNTAIFGGLLLLFAGGSGRCSIDGK